jgi:hypothetical protein
MRASIACIRSLPLALALVAAVAPAASGATCMYGQDGKVVHRPDGADCRDIAGAQESEAAFSAPRPTAEGEWLPIHSGDEHIFAVEITQGRSDYGKPFRYTSYKGTQHRSVIPAPERFGPGALERRLTLRVTQGGAGVDQTDLQRDFIRSTASGYQLLAMNRFWYFKRQDVDYGEGSILLPAQVAKGAKWSSGKIRDDVFKIDETGEVVDLQAVTTPAGAFENCLHVRYSGDIGSRRTRLDGRATVVGRYVRDVWLARGVGVVREREEGRLETIQRGETFAFTSKYDASIKGVKRPAVPANQR